MSPLVHLIVAVAAVLGVIVLPLKLVLVCAGIVWLLWLVVECNSDSRAFGWTGIK